MLRPTWVQPEDLIGHELRQAAQDGRDPSAIAARWRAAGGREAPARAGTSAQPASSASACWRKTCWTNCPACRARWRTRNRPNWTGSRPCPRLARPPTRSRVPRPSGSGLARPSRRLPPRQARREAPPDRHPPARRGRRQLAPDHLLHRPGLPADLTATYPWNRRSAPTSSPRTSTACPRTTTSTTPAGPPAPPTPRQDLHHRRRRPRLARRAARRPHLHRRTPRLPQSPHRHRTPAHRPPPQPLPRVDRRPDPRRRARLDQPRRPGRRRRAGAPRRDLTHTANGVYAAMFAAAVIATAATGTHDVHACLRTGLTVVPPGSRLAEAVRHGVQLAETHADFDGVVDALHARHSPPTTGSTPSPTPPCSRPPSPTRTATSPDRSPVPCREAGTPTQRRHRRQRRRSPRRFSRRPARALDGPAEEPPGHLGGRLRRHRLRHPRPPPHREATRP